MELSAPRVVNTHHFGGIDKLPPSVVYIGRPSAYGNAYSSKSGVWTREECIALHRIDLYRSLKQDPNLLAQLRHDLVRHDLACWCKQPNRVVGCHGDNYLHIFSDRNKDRLYDQSVIFYLMDDLRYMLGELQKRITQEVSDEQFLMLDIHLGDIRVDITEAVRICREKKVPFDILSFFLASMVIDLELAFIDPDPVMITYRFDHVHWLVFRFTHGRNDRYGEPVPPNNPLRRKIKKG